MARASNKRSEFIAALERVMGSATTMISRQDVKRIVESEKVEWPHWLTNGLEFRNGQRGMYVVSALLGNPGAVATQAPQKMGVTAVAKRVKKIPTFRPSMPAHVPSVEVAGPSAVPVLVDSAQLGSATELFTHQSLVPAEARGYVPFGHFNTVKTILASGMFYPAFVTGLSGNGKTMMIEQICAKLGREFVRVNVTGETDEDDLIGGFRLQDGKTVWQDGPVVVAMKRGAVLLLDEVDLGTNKLMCLQPVLEGKPIYLKKINMVVTPAKGFNVLATANTKGQGSFDGKFVGTNVMNEAMLERFPVTIEQEYAPVKVEEKILAGVLGMALDEKGETLDAFYSSKAIEFTERLVSWADGIRKLYAEGGITEIISTRRLVAIVNAFVLFGYNRRMAVELCLARFDHDTKTQFVDLYSKIDVEFDELVLPTPAVVDAGVTGAAAEAVPSEPSPIAKAADPVSSVTVNAPMNPGAGPWAPAPRGILNKIAEPAPITSADIKAILPADSDIAPGILNDLVNDLNKLLKV